MLERFDARFFDGRLADRMQNRSARRAAAILYVLLLVVFGSLMGWAVWLFVSPADGGMALIFPANGNLALVFLSLVVGIIAPVIERVLVMAIRSAIPLAGEPFDERQQQVYAKAQIDARRFVLSAMAVAMVTGLYMLLAMANGTAPYSIPLYAWICATLFLVARAAHHVVLAWQLPDEISEDVELGYER